VYFAIQLKLNDILFQLKTEDDDILKFKKITGLS